MSQHEHQGGRDDCCGEERHHRPHHEEQHDGHGGCDEGRGLWHDHCCCGGDIACGQDRHFRRRFQTREERVARLEEYLRDLQSEAKAVEERIAELKAVG